MRSYAPTLVFCKGFREAREVWFSNEAGLKVAEVDMVEYAHVKHETSISRFYHHLAERKGRQVAIVATARKLLLRYYSVLKNRNPYQDQAS